MVSCEISSPGLQLLSQLGPREGEGGVHGPPSHAPCIVDQLSHQFCRVSLCLFSLRVTCADPPAVVLSSLQSILSVATASWLSDCCIFGSPCGKGTLVLVGNVEREIAHYCSQVCWGDWTKTGSSKGFRIKLRVLLFTWPHPPSPFDFRACHDSHHERTTNPENTCSEWGGLKTQRAKGCWCGSYWLCAGCGSYLVVDEVRLAIYGSSRVVVVFSDVRYVGDPGQPFSEERWWQHPAHSSSLRTRFTDGLLLGIVGGSLDIAVDDETSRHADSSNEKPDEDRVNADSIDRVKECTVSSSIGQTEHRISSVSWWWPGSSGNLHVMPISFWMICSFWMIFDRNRMYLAELNALLACTNEGFMVEGDPRHADSLRVTTGSTNTIFRWSQHARVRRPCGFLVGGSWDLTFAAKELCIGRKHSSRISNYAGNAVNWADWFHAYFDASGDANLAGDVVTRHGTTSGVVKYGIKSLETEAETRLFIGDDRAEYAYESCP